MLGCGWFVGPAAFLERQVFSVVCICSGVNVIPRGLNAGAVLVFSSGNVILLTLNLILSDDDCILAAPCGCVRCFCVPYSVHMEQKRCSLSLLLRIQVLRNLKNMILLTIYEWCFFSPHHHRHKPRKHVSSVICEFNRKRI